MVEHWSPLDCHIWSPFVVLLHHRSAQAPNVPGSPGQSWNPGYLAVVPGSERLYYCSIVVLDEDHAGTSINTIVRSTKMNDNEEEGIIMHSCTALVYYYN